jgi:predicted O-linked N-acetylglucosamine transferase (SPINDLY family)
MKQATTTVQLDEIRARKSVGDFVGAAELIAQALTETPEYFLDPSAWAQLLNHPATFEHTQEHEANVLFMTAVMTMLEELCEQIGCASAQSLYDAFLQGAQFRLTAHSDVDVKDLMVMRARIFLRSSFVLAERDFSFATPVANPWRPRIGILFRRLRADPETTSLLPFFSQSKKSGIETIIFVAEEHPMDAFGHRMASSCDRIIPLPAYLPQAVRALREADLDILVFGNDITAKASLGACLSFHRVARRAVCTVSTLVTSASPYVDEYFGGGYHAQRGAASEFVERYTSLPGPGFAFCFGEEKSPSQVTINRAQLGLSEETMLFVSGANQTKLHGPVLDAWVEILRHVPDSALFLYPFPPHFGPAQDTVVARLRGRFKRNGVNPARIIVLPQLPGRSAVKSLLRQMDIGLDSFPYPGVTTIVDAIESHLPTVTLAGQSLRSAQAAAVLSSVGMDELITYDVEGYIQTAVTLATQNDLRHAFVGRLKNIMAGTPPFLDDIGFGRAAVHEYFRIHDELKKQEVNA